MRKILILYTSIGQGHKSIAENIGFYLQQAGFGVELYDVLKVQDVGLARGGTKLYGFLINKFPFVWDWLYNASWFINLTLPLRLWVASFNYDKILQKINELKPDLVISTQVTGSGVMAYLKKKGLYGGKFAIACSDFHLHRYWLYKEADFYLANIVEQKQEMIELGVPGSKIFVCGMILKLKMEVDHESVIKKFDINPGEKVVLIASGYQGTGIDESLISKLIGKPGTRVIVACGKNKELYEKLSHKFAKTSATILGFYTPFEELYAVADIFITKPGGLSVSGALQSHTPILVSHLLPGGERHNYSYLVAKGWVMPKSDNLLNQALEELETGAFRQALINNRELPALFNGQDSMLEAVKKALLNQA